MTEGKRPVGRPKGSKASEKQKATNPQARKASAAKRAERKAVRKAEREADIKPRWKQLEDGDLSLKDLTLKELIRGQVANNDGSWDGKRHEFSPKWQQRMATEFRRKFRRDFDKLAPLAIEAMEDILQDEDNPAQRWAAAKTMIEYQMGKVPEVVHVGAETEFDRLAQTGFVILRGEQNVMWEDDEEDSDAPAPLVVKGELA
jgi:hypothetical protein